MVQRWSSILLQLPFWACTNHWDLAVWSASSLYYDSFLNPYCWYGLAFTQWFVRESACCCRCCWSIMFELFGSIRPRWARACFSTRCVSCQDEIFGHFTEVVSLCTNDPIRCPRFLFQEPQCRMPHRCVMNFRSDVVTMPVWVASTCVLRCRRLVAHICVCLCLGCLKWWNIQFVGRVLFGDFSIMLERVRFRCDVCWSV